MRLVYQRSNQKSIYFLIIMLRLFASYDTPLSASLTFPLTGEPYSQNLRNGSTSNKLSLSIASDVSTTNSFYGACACKNWVFASRRDACEAGRESTKKAPAKGHLL